MIRDVLAKRDSPPTKIIKRPHSQELGHVFSRFGFYSFLGEYFSDDFRKPINDLIEQIEIGTKGNYAFWPMSDYKASKAAFSSFSSEDIVRDVRINTISPFSKKTAQKFLPILKDHHHLAYTMFAIQTCIGRFFQTVEKEFEIGRVETPKYLERFLNNSILLNSFFSELLPHILISLDKQPSTECTAWHYSDGLTESFKRSAWRTQRTTSPNNFNRGDINVITCPFSGFIKDLWDTVYVENDEGVLSPTTLKQDGAFPVMVARRLLELESSSPQLRPLSFIK